MLTGRESLIRLIGKRRKFLPNRHSILFDPIQSSDDGIALAECAKGSSEDEMRGSIDEEMGKCVSEVSTAEWVNCPVCGDKVRGEDYTINTHLDACLSRGTKRKLTQRTLLQLKFCSRSKAKIQSSESVNSGTVVVQGDPDDDIVQNTTHKFHDICAFEEEDSNQCGSLDSPLKLKIVQNHVNASIEKADKVDTPSLALDNKIPFDKAVTMNNISGVILETFIVGRKFSDEKEIHLGANVSLLRDPNNVKDPNAIKVLSSDSGCCKVLGFLPRELARYLSPLIEKYCLIFEGSVVSVATNSLDVVRIQVVCQKVTYIHEKDYDDLRVFESLWKNVLRVIESAKTYPPNMTKYQKNFCLLIQEVLQSNPHLFTEDEKILLESFNSLSDDSQRLFVRIYTRRGPWFRMSKMYYPEILNSEQAIKGLSETGYISSFGSINEVHEDDMKKILNVLTVSELREISCLLKKKSNHGTRKQDVIASLLSSYKDGFWYEGFSVRIH
ncbi:hypothetical protein L1049_001795 [Liquidambar formosana]|uniref:Fanconi-associated nuclease n=1 Tax=Liquidambar formosana TaxID=63359 RepID=A0AAP0R2Q9_LIQFO